MHSLQILSIRLIPSGEFDFVYVFVYVNNFNCDEIL